MKLFLWAFALLFYLMALSGAAWGEGAVITLVPTGNIDEGLVSEVKSWCEKFLDVPISVADALENSCDSMDSELDRLHRVFPETGGLVIGLTAFPEEVRAHGAMRPQWGIAIVNVSALGRDRPEDSLLSWRVQKETMRAIGLLLGLETCPNPHCALHPYTNMQQLDRLGLNYCPPCMMKSRALLQQRMTAINPSR